MVWALTRIVAASAQSDTEHLTTVAEGLRLFSGSPIIGTGIGFYVQQHLGQTVAFPVIHSTAAWLLAETGLVGFFAFAAPFAWLLVSGWFRRHSNDLSAQIIVPVLVAFAITSLAHELLYQRPFWFLLGATAAATSRGQLRSWGASSGRDTRNRPTKTAGASAAA
jgi:O-antigen ligase